MTTRLAVLGSPIAHSKSPALHSAAYRALGLDWQYEAVEVTGESLTGFMASLDASWRGLSLTMPLKQHVVGLLDSRDEIVAITGAANTVLLSDGAHGFNTDVYGIAQAFRAAGIASLERVHILGGGATAASALVACSTLGATRAVVVVRNQEKAAHLSVLGATLGLDVELRAMSSVDESSTEAPTTVISTLPGHIEHGLTFSREVRHDSVLFDVAYDPWPSLLATDWLAAGGTVISGREMLLHQAVAQVRIFTAGDPAVPLNDEPTVLAAMRASISG